MIKKVLIVLYNIIFSIVLLELCLFAFNPAPLFETITIDPINDDRYEGDYMLSTDRTLLYVPKPNTNTFNALGYRGDLLSMGKKRNKTRIIFLGDSVAYGINIPFEKCFTKLLNDRLGNNHEVMNLAVPGYNTIQEIQYLKKRGIQFNPDYVFICSTVNDNALCSGEAEALFDKINTMNSMSFYYHYYTIKDTIEKKLLTFNTFRYIKYFSILIKEKKKRISPDADCYSIEEEGLQHSLQSLIHMSKKNNFKIVFILLPALVHETNDFRTLEEIKNALVDNNIKYFDLNDYVSENYNLEYIKKLFPRNDPLHFNKEGHAFIANLIYQNFDLLIE